MKEGTRPLCYPLNAIAKGQIKNLSTAGPTAKQMVHNSTECISNTDQIAILSSAILSLKQKIK